MLEKIKMNLLRKFEWMAEIERTNVATAILHQQTFPQFKNICEGKKLVVCGAGPTLEKYKPINDAVHIAVNRAFLYERVNFDYIFAQDWDGIKMVKDELRDYQPERCIKLLGSQMGYGMDEKEISESYATSCHALRFNVDIYLYKNGFKSKFVKDIDKMALGNMPNVGMSVLQFALYMNPKELYIVGCDMKGTHFADGNQTKEELEAERKQYNINWTYDAKRLIDKWLEFKKFASIYYPYTRIISVNPVGLRGIFEDWDQE